MEKSDNLVFFSEPLNEMESLDSEDSEVSFSVHELQEVLNEIEQIQDIPSSLLNTGNTTQFVPGKINVVDPLSYVTVNIPRTTKPQLVDGIVGAFSEATFQLDKNPPPQFSDSFFEFDVLSLLSNHSKIKSLSEFQRLFTGSADDPMRNTNVFHHREFLIITIDASSKQILHPDTMCAIGFWRFADLNRIGIHAQHFTKFVIYCVVNDEPLLDIANLIAVLCDEPRVYSSMWNGKSNGDIIHIIEETKNEFLFQLVSAHQAIEKISEKIHIVEDEIDIHRNDWLHRKLLLNHELSPSHKHEIENEEISLSSVLCCNSLGKGISDDYKRRIGYYESDWTDGLSFKPFMVAIFLALGILPYVFIFGTSLDNHTNGYMNSWHVLIATIVGGVFMSLFSPQPMIFLSPSAAFILFLRTSDELSTQYGTKLSEIYPLMSIITSIFLIFFAFLNISSAMKYVTSFSDEVFVVFVAFLFILDAFKEILSSKNQFLQIASSFVSFSVLVMTLVINRFRKSTLTFSWVRSICSDTAPIISTLTALCLLRFGWRDVYKQLPQYSVSALKGHVVLISFGSLNAKQIFLATILGFCSAVLIFFEHNITAKLVNGEEMRLRKPPAYHLDLFVLSIINMILGIFSLPMIVASKLHTFHHIHSMSVHTFQFNEEGEPCSVYINVQETRWTGLISHIVLALCLLFPSIIVMPRAIFAGILAFMGVVTIGNTQLFTQLCSLFWNPQSLPPEHWLRNVKRWKVFSLNLIQILSIIAVYYIEHSIIGFLYPLFVLILVIFYRILYHFFETDMIMVEKGIDKRM